MCVQARFDGGEYLFGYVELSLSSVVRIAGALSPSLDPCGFEDYAMDEPPFDDSDDLFIFGSGPFNSALLWWVAVGLWLGMMVCGGG